MQSGLERDVIKDVHPNVTSERLSLFACLLVIFGSV